MKFRIFIIGCGKISGLGNIPHKQTHAGAIKSIDDYELGYCFDTNYERSLEYASRFNCKVSSNILDTLLTYKPHLVSICSPDSTHFDICKLILNSKITSIRVLFVEKPICHNPDEFQYLKKLSHKKNIKILINHTRRFNDKYSYLKKLIKKDYLGKVIRINGIYYGGWIHNAIHLLDSIYYIFDDIPKFQNVQKTSRVIDKYDYFLEISGQMKKSLALINIQSIDEKFYQIYGIDIWFEDGRVRLNNFDEEFIVEKKVINAINENVLTNFEKNYERQIKTEMVKSYELILDFLKGKNNKILNLISLEKLEPVMNILWLGVSLFKEDYEN
mgnify:CR=1 FL=1|tara:strand:+ start:53 stop:1039 length:987 start_codon:yes stop_codon:yes gene_type:complete